MEPHGHLSFVVLIAYSSLVYDNMHDSRIRKIFFFSNILSMAFSIDMTQVSIMIHIDIQLSESESESDSPVLVGAIEIQWAISGILAGHGRVATKGKNCSSFFFSPTLWPLGHRLTSVKSRSLVVSQLCAVFSFSFFFNSL